MKSRITIVFLSILLLTPVFASAASVSPSAIELEGARGQQLVSRITIINTSDIAQTYYLDVMNFSAKDEGVPEFSQALPDDDGIVSWIHFPFSEVLVPARSKLDVLFEILIPSSAFSGGHYGAVTVSNAPSDIVASNGALIEAKTAVLVLLTVLGETKQAWEMLEFVNGVHSQNPVRDNLDVAYQYRIQNQGNVHLTPTGTVELKDIFGRKLLSFDANQSKGRVLPGTTRTYSVTRSPQTGFLNTLQDQLDHFTIGPVYAHANLFFAAHAESVSFFSFWYVPWQLITLVLAVIVIFYMVLRVSKKK